MNDDDDYRPFRRGEMKDFKKQIAKHARESGNEKMATDMWKDFRLSTRQNNQRRPRP